MNSEFTTQLWCLDALLSRGPGERPGRSRAAGYSGIRPSAPPPPAHRRVINTIAVRSCAYDPDIRAAHPRQLGNWAARFSYTPHPPTRPVRLTAATRAPWSHPTGDRPTPPLIRFLVARRRRPAKPDTAGAAVRHRTATGHPAQRAQGARTRLQLRGTRGTAFIDFRRPRPTLATRERQSPTQVTLSLSTPL